MSKHKDPERPNLKLSDHENQESDFVIKDKP